MSFAIALNNMSRGEMTPDDINLLKSRIVNCNSVPESAIRLFYMNCGRHRSHQSAIDGYIKKRTKPLILRRWRASLEKSASDYYREMIMMFFHWRNGDLDFIQGDTQNTFNCNKAVILERGRRWKEPINFNHISSHHPPGE